MLSEFEVNSDSIGRRASGDPRRSPKAAGSVFSGAAAALPDGRQVIPDWCGPR